jgi:exopolysaccharide biosynthesis protein
MRTFYVKLAFVLMFTFLLLGCDNSDSQDGVKIQWSSASGSESGVFHANVAVDEGTGVKDFLVVKIDPKKFEFEIYENKDKKLAKTIEEIHTEQGSTITFNGTFFTDEFKPTGLIMNKGIKLNKVSEANLLDGILAIDENGNTHFFDQLSKNKFNTSEKYEFAIQNGPILLDAAGNIKILSDDGKRASRTAMGLDKNRNIIIIIVKQSLFKIDNSISLYNFARLLKEDPAFSSMGLHSVINLDGGSSTGLKIGNKYFPEMEKVQNVVLVKGR